MFLSALSLPYGISSRLHTIIRVLSLSLSHTHTHTHTRTHKHTILYPHYQKDGEACVVDLGGSSPDASDGVKLIDRPDFRLLRTFAVGVEGSILVCTGRNHALQRWEVTERTSAEMAAAASSASGVSIFALWCCTPIL